MVVRGQTASRDKKSVLRADYVLCSKAAIPPAVIEDGIYNATDMNRKLVLERRDEVVAAKIIEYLKATDRYAKTIVFCEDMALVVAENMATPAI